MINLLPSERKQAYLFARRNNSLLKIIIGIFSGIIILAVITGLCFLFIKNETNSYRASVASSQTELNKQDEAKTIARVKEISSNLKLMVKVLNQEVLFSELLKQLGAVMPSGTSLKNLSLSDDLSGALDLEISSVDYNSASQAQLNIQDPNNKIFKSADIISINCTQKDPTYPCLALLKTTFSPDNSFMLLSKQQGSN